MSGNNISTIGIIGVCGSAGATQLSIMTGNYHVGVLHKKTAVVGNDEAYENLKKSDMAGSVKGFDGFGSRYGFSYGKLDIYNDVRDSFIEVLKSQYEVVVIDLNIENAVNDVVKKLEVVSACDKIILVGSTVPWKSREMMNRMNRIGEVIKLKDLKLASVNYDRKMVSLYEREYKVKVVMTPQESEPFRLKGSNLLWMRNLIYGNS
ncbi:MAG: hypothetical protein Q4F06_07400 [Eubacteriales bacterium]|nr:hypothetical protein [Eubacteriales bacterium]